MPTHVVNTFVDRLYWHMANIQTDLYHDFLMEWSIGYIFIQHHINMLYNYHLA